MCERSKSLIKEDRIKGIEAGADDFLTKPVDPRELLARIQTALKLKRVVDRKIGGQSVPDKTFQLEGEYWTIPYQGTAVRSKDTLGLRYLAYLLRHPHKQIHALELVRLAGGPFAGAARGSTGERDAAAFANLSVHQGLGDAGEMLDPTAKTVYKQRLAELRAELKDARTGDDVGRVAKTQRDIEFLTPELQRAVGLGGRDRRAASPAEQARVNVQRAIQAALKKLSAKSSSLGALPRQHGPHRDVLFLYP